MDITMMLGLLKKLKELRRHEGWTRAQLEAYQTKELNTLREYAYTHSPFYQQFHKGLTNRPLSELPVLTKAMLMEHFDELVTDRSLRLEEVRAFAAQSQAGQRFRNRYWVNATSGSSGRPGIFLFDHDEWTSVLATFGRAHEWAGVPMLPTHRMKMASVASHNSGSPCHMSAQVPRPPTAVG